MVGEIVASGPSITKGYWNDPQATAEKYHGGLLRTGDLAMVDEDGYVYVVDRVADFIKSWGIRISSQEIEEVALGIPGILGAAAVGIPDEVAGEAVALFIVPSDGELTADDVLATLRRTARQAHGPAAGDHRAGAAAECQRQTGQVPASRTRGIVASYQNRGERSAQGVDQQGRQEWLWPGSPVDMC